MPGPGLSTKHVVKGFFPSPCHEELTFWQVGCKTVWDRWSGEDVPLCTTEAQFRSHLQTYTWKSMFFFPATFYSFPICKVFFLLKLRSWLVNKFRKYDHIYELLSNAETKEIKQIANCTKPCNYKKYVLVGERKQSSFESEYFIFSIWAVSKNTVVKTEHLIYPISSLVAEFGGTLGIFLGFSFVALWDQIYDLRSVCLALKRLRSTNFGESSE